MLTACVTISENQENLLNSKKESGEFKNIQGTEAKDVVVPALIEFYKPGTINGMPSETTIIVQ